MKPTRHNYNRAKAVDYFLDKLDNEEIRYSDIRKEMEQERIDADEINIVTKLIDNIIQKTAIDNSKKSNGRQIYVMGWILVIFGTLITVFTYLSDSKAIVIAFGLVTFGAKQVFQGYSLMNSNTYSQRMRSRKRNKSSDMFK